MRRVTADSKTLMDQAPITAALYLREARLSVEREFGKSYCAAHPELVVAVLAASTQDFHTSILAGTLEEITETIVEAYQDRPRE